MLAEIEAKRMGAAALAAQVRAWQAAGERVVFTNGCFDLVHYGHVHYLAQARALGERLVIGLNSDASVRRLKGAKRPIVGEASRALLLAALVCTDAVCLFETDTPYELIALLQPDILVKGGDWRPEQIVGADVVLARGGQVLSLPFVSGYSTTNIEQTILARGKEA